MFGPQIKQEVIKAIDALLDAQMGTIDEVHETDGEIALAIKVKLMDLGKNGLNWYAELAFVKEKVKVGISGQTDEKQMGLPMPEGVESVTVMRDERVVEMKRPFKSNQV